MKRRPLCRCKRKVTSRMARNLRKQELLQERRKRESATILGMYGPVKIYGPNFYDMGET